MSVKIGSMFRALKKALRTLGLDTLIPLCRLKTAATLAQTPTPELAGQINERGEETRLCTDELHPIPCPPAGQTARPHRDRPKAPLLLRGVTAGIEVDG